MNQPTDNSLVTTYHEDVLTITLNRPHVMNAMDQSMFARLGDVFEQAASDQAIRVVVLRGAGGNFCSGADLNLLSRVSDPAEADRYLTLINSFITRFHHLDKPTIAVIEGVAVGAGLNLALHADFVVASEDARLQEPFVQIGLTTDFGGTYLLPRLVGLARAKRLALLAERLSGREAEQIGLIYRAVPQAELDQTVDQLISLLRRMPRLAYAATKAGLNKGMSASLSEMLVWEREQQPRLIASEEFQALIAARAKRS
ncbi:MAG: enoyl-CoA hydratase/isomerase family protein [Brevibacillus sp.]|nr:enoyl-CoA hydratase/isomerase family protein [Brevibacillus sp.]